MIFYNYKQYKVSSKKVKQQYLMKITLISFIKYCCYDIENDKYDSIAGLNPSIFNVFFLCKFTFE